MRIFLPPFLAVLTACSHFHPAFPETEIPAAWKEPVPTAHYFEEKNRFWELLDDPLLNVLEEEAQGVRVAVFQVAVVQEPGQPLNHPAPRGNCRLGVSRDVSGKYPCLAQRLHLRRQNAVRCRAVFTKGSCLFGHFALQRVVWRGKRRAVIER